MALVRAYRNGNWSDTNVLTSPWSNGTVVAVPDQNDHVYINNKIINIDQNIKVFKLTNEASVSRTWKDGQTGTAVNGGYAIPVGNVKIEGIVVGGVRTDSSAPTYTLMLGGSSKDVTVIGTLSGTFVANGGGCIAATSDYVNKLTVVGTLLPNGSGANGTYRCILLNGPAKLYFTGTAYGGYAGTGFDGSGNLTSDASGIASGSIAGQIYVTGDVYGGRGGQVSPGIYISSGGINKLSVVGNIYASDVSTAIYYNNHYRNLYVSGNIIDHPSNGRTAIYAPNYYLNPIPKNGAIYKQGNELFFLSDSLSAFSMPPISSVRTGITFANATLTGICAVPSISSVSLGVPVDNKVGVSILNPADFFKTNISKLTPSTFVQRITSTTTVDSIGKFLFSTNNK